MHKTARNVRNYIFCSDQALGCGRFGRDRLFGRAHYPTSRMSVTSPLLTRIFLAADLSVKALYDDSSLFNLASSGSTFTNVDPHGISVTQLTLYAIKRYKRRLAEVVKFRNLHVDSALTPPGPQDSSYHLGYRVSSVKWPSSAAVAEAEGQLRFQPDGSTVLDSEDSAARIVLHPNTSRIAVCYPLLIPSASATQHQYIWQTQLFSIHATPMRWRWPLHLLQEASAARQAKQQQTESDTAQWKERLQNQQPLNRTTELPTAAIPGTVLTTFPKESWWFDCSHRLPHNIVILLEWTPEVLYQYSPDTHEAAAWIHNDESCLLSERQGAFLRHCKGVPQPDRLYAAEAVPMHSSSPGSRRYALAEFAEHALLLRQLCASIAVHNSQNMAGASEKCGTASLDSLQKPEVSEIYEQHEVPDCGTFTAYTDGSIHVTFHDRALLYMKKSQEHCEVITPDGHRVTVNTATPLGVEQYVAQAVEFADWACSSPSERAAALHQAATIQKEIGKCQRAAALCDWAQGQLVSVPHSSEQISGGCMDSAVSETNLASFCRSPMQEYTTPAEREQVIEALLAKSSYLLNMLSN